MDAPLQQYQTPRLENISDDRCEQYGAGVSDKLPNFSTVYDAVKYVQQSKLIPAIPQFITDGLTGADVVQFNQYLSAGVLSSFNIEVVQGLVQAQYDPDMGGVVLRITQLIAGFLIGPRGLSIRDLAQGTGCVIKSWTEDASLECPRDTRVFVLEGSTDCVLMCLDVVIAAIDRYKDLAEGRWGGQYVNKTQKIKGFVFVYYPPPKDRVPMAAGIRGFPPSSKQAVAARSLLGLPDQSYQTALQSICAHMAGPIPAPIQPTTSSSPLSEDMDDLGATYGGIFPSRIYNPKVDSRGHVEGGNNGVQIQVPVPDAGFNGKVGLSEYSPRFGMQQQGGQLNTLACEVCSALVKGIKITNPSMFSGSVMCAQHKAVFMGMFGNRQAFNHKGKLQFNTGVQKQNIGDSFMTSAPIQQVNKPPQDMNMLDRFRGNNMYSNPVDSQPLQDICKYLSDIIQNGQPEDVTTLKSSLDALSTQQY
eukprot:TRINITY_DN25098_c0_g1_i1.p1 TRINITY_DN25098_c0_g1~~TRINITY_DN25098_c0_g1_i1.p1  ORF type:complete len:475 (-),score=57.88 TRINITY_DN25098_c0_g1_i1:863-2287(-)